MPTARRLVYLCFCLCLITQTSCRPKTVDVKEDLQQYMDKARLWAATEGQINNAIAAVRRDQFVHDDFVVETLKPVVGVSRDYIQELEQYRPQSQPLMNVHQEYIEAWRAHYFAMAAITDAMEKKDYIQLAKANNDLLEAQRSVSDALADLARLLREAGIQKDEAPATQPPQPPDDGFVVSPSGPPQK
jgi:phage I-like protein